MDHYGLKPLFWAEDDDFIYFSSEVKAINAAGFASAPSPSGLFEYLFHGLPLSDRTMQKGIRCINPGTVLEIGLEDLSKRFHTYYKPEVHVSEKRCLEYDSTPEHVLLDELERLITSSVDNLIDTGSKTGIFLSGGVDSSLVTALISRKHPDILPWTVEVTDVQGFSERPYAEKAAQHLGLDLNVVELNAQVFRENLVKTINVLETPLILENAVALYAASARLKDAGIDIVMDGEGADSLFGGSTNVYKWDLMRLQMRKALPFMKTLGEEALLRIMRIMGRTGARVIMPGSAGGEGLHFSLGAGGFDRDSLMDHIRGLYSFIRDDAEREIHTALLNEFYCYMRPCYQRLTQSTMAHGLEVRLPFMGTDVVDFCVNLPLRHKIRGSGLRPVTKYLLKKLSERYVPKSLLYRPKMGFGIPGPLYIGSLPDNWLDHGYIVSEYDIPRAYAKEWFNASLRNRDRFLFTTLEIWGQIFIQGRPHEQVEEEFLSMAS